MTDATALPLERPRRFYFDWLLPFLLRPKTIYARIMALGRSTWFTPLLVLTLTALAAVAVAGPIKIAANQSGQSPMPEVFQYWTPEQQAQYIQAQQITSTGPVFIYVFPGIVAVLRLWFGWLVMGGLLHLILTMLGGRDNTGGALNIVAWAALPFAIRDLVRVGFMLIQKQLLANPGLSGFAPVSEGWLYAVLGDLLARIDLYTVWYVILLFLGVRASVGLSAGKSLAGLLIALLLMLLLGLVPTIVMSQLSGLSIMQPFFY
ncbi:MAG: YIP1 family protein [Anaerolineales bacterium]|nr:YIP1 family protein [Anaerolineales bacterium]